MTTDPNPDLPVDIPISPGTTWTDQAGNTWTSYGSLVMGDDSVQNTRQNLILFLRNRHNLWQWYDYPPDNIHTPAVAINPSDPYIVPFTASMSDPDDNQGMSVMWLFDLVLIVNRSQPASGLIRLEFMFTEIQNSLQNYPQLQWTEFGEIGSTEIGGVEYLTGVLSLAIVSQLAD